MSQQLIFTDNPAAALTPLIEGEQLFILADSNTSLLVVKRMAEEQPLLKGVPVIVIPAGDNHKNTESLSIVWQALSMSGATRRATLLNVGGGMVTDLGGFAAATFKRGIRFINLPTTLLGAVDAAVGGKTGINFAGYKNEVGAFCEAEAVVISAGFFGTLPASELLSGYGEVLKHSLLSSAESVAKALTANPVSNPTSLLPIVQESVEVKRGIVALDPHEHGLRKALNLGHTAAHAFETLAFSRGKTVPHGYAVAWGLVVDLVLSHMLHGFPSATLHAVAAFVDENYPKPEISCNDYPALIDYMRHDKKNATPQGINFTLLKAPGQVELNCIVAPDTITAALDITRDLLHI